MTDHEVNVFQRCFIKICVDYFTLHEEDDGNYHIEVAAAIAALTKTIDNHICNGDGSFISCVQEMLDDADSFIEMEPIQ